MSSETSHFPVMLTKRLFQKSHATVLYPWYYPIERLWKYMKTDYIHNRVFTSIKQMMADMADVFAELNPNDAVDGISYVITIITSFSYEIILQLPAVETYPVLSLESL